MNDRYLHEHIEGHAFCPFARGGGPRWGDQPLRPLRRHREPRPAPRPDDERRQRPATGRGPGDPPPRRGLPRGVDPLRRRAHGPRPRPPRPARGARLRRPCTRASATTPRAPRRWSRCFRRAPDPTIQWVRASTPSHDIYEGATTTPASSTCGKRQYVKSATPRASLYDRIADANAAEAARLGVARLEAMLADIAEDGRRGCTVGSARGKGGGERERTRGDGARGR